jgi:hypothetical protein
MQGGTAVDVGMPFRYPRISISNLAHYFDKYKDSKIDLETKKGKSNTYSTRTLVNPSLVAYIKPDRGAPRGTSDIRLHVILERQDRLERD